MRSKTISILMSIGLIVTSACQAIGLGEPTTTPTLTSTATATAIATQTPTSTPLSTLVEPDLPEGDQANLYGRVVWQGQPVPGVQMHLYGFSEVAGIVLENATSDDNGVFLFSGIPAVDDYELDARFDQEDLPPHLQSRILSSPEWVIEVPAGENVNLGNFSLFAGDLQLLSPERFAKLTDPYPILSWEAIPDASSYELEVRQAYGNLTDFTVEITDTMYQVEEPLIDCLYWWDVTALDAEGNPIARSDRYADESIQASADFDGNFTIENEELTWCHLALYSPVDYQDFYGGWDLEFEIHPMAAYYIVYVRRMRNAQGDIDLEFYRTDPIRLDQDGNLISGSLPIIGRGQFIIKVWAYTEDGLMIAETSEVRFEVK